MVDRRHSYDHADDHVAAPSRASTEGAAEAATASSDSASEVTTDWSEEDDSEEDNYLATDSAVSDFRSAVALSNAQLTPSGAQLSPGVSGQPPTFGNVAVSNSTDVQFGNKTYYNGPVTIKQIVYAARATDAAAAAVPAIDSGSAEVRVPVAEDAAPPLGVKVVANGKLPSEEPVLNTTKTINGSRVSEGSEAGLLTSNGDVSVSIDRGGGSPSKWWHPGDWGRGAQVLGAVALLLVATGLVTVLLLLPSPREEGDSQPELPHPWQTEDNNLTLSGKLRIIPRRDWLAQPPIEREFLKLPVPYVIISHSASEGCSKQAECTLMVRNLQTFHIESKGWADIAYNFLVGGDGYVYEGRGWDVIAAHTYGWNNASIGINMIGTFISVLPPERQLTAAKQLIAMGVSMGKIAQDYKLFGHRQLSATESPGSALYKEITTWPHWAEAPCVPSSDSHCGTSN